MEIEPGTFYQQFSSIIDWVGTHQTLTGIAIFLIAMTESLVLIGILMPGAVLMVGAGILVSLGKLEFWPVIAWAAAGAIAGDGLSFWVGYHYKDRLRQVWPFTKTKKLLLKGEDFFKRHGGKSIVLGRFFGPVRAIVPTIAGMLGMKPRRFAFVNILSALAWAPAYILPGLVVGASLQLASEIAVRLVLVMILLVVFYIISHWLIKHLVRYLQHHTQSMTHAVLSWSTRHPLIGPYTSAILKPDTSAYKSLLISGAIFLTASLLFISILVFGFADSKHSSLSYTSYQFLQSLRSPSADYFMVLISMLVDPWIYLTTLVVSSIWLVYRKSITTLLHLLLATGITALLVLALGTLLPKPDAIIISDISASAITHTTLSFVIFGFMAILLSHGNKNNTGGYYITVSSVIILVIISKLYLGHYWLSEIITNIVLGVILLSFIGISLQKYSHPRYYSKHLAIIGGITLILSISFHLFFHFEKTLKANRLTLSVKSLSFNQWWTKQWRKMPTWRSDLRGYQHQPLNIQFAGDLKQLRNYLINQGWKRPAKFRIKNMVHWLNSSASLADLPVLPQVHQGRHHLLILTYPALSTFWKSTPERQWVLRLWKSHFKLLQGNTPIYIGNVSTQTTHKALGILAYPNTSKDFNSPMNVLLSQIKRYRFKVEKRQSSSHKSNNWNGQLLLFTGKLKTH